MFESLKKLIAGPPAGPPGATDPAAPPPGSPAAADFHASEEQFAKLVSGVRDYAVFLLDRAGNVVTWNAGAERIKGYRPEQIIGRHFSTFYPNEAISSGWPAHELEVAAATGRFEDEGWRLRQDGSRFWASVVITALRDEAGEVRGFLKITRDLTDRKQAEEKLRLSEERFRLIVEGVKDYAIFMLDPQGRVATWNAGAERLKGYKANEIIGRHFSTFYPQEARDRGWPEEKLQRAVADGRVEDEGWRVRKDGTRFWAGVVLTALRDDAGTLRGFAKVTRDLTERREAEEQARRLIREEAARKAAQDAAEQIEREREQLRVTLASIGDGVVVTDAAGRVTFLNPVAAGLTGWPPADAEGKSLGEVFPIVNEHTREPVPNPVETALRENRVVGLANHTNLLSRDGREVPIEDSAAPIRGAGGAVGGAVLVFRDVTEARRSRADRQYLAAIVESSDDAIIGQTLDGRIASWNRGAERLYGYTAAEIVGRPVAVLVPPDHPDEVPALLDRIRRGEAVEHFETERVRKDGTLVEVSLTISPVRDATGRVIGASKIARDITARKAEDRRRTEFLSLLAHELRNPLAPLRNGLQVLRMAGGDPAATGRVRGMMERQVEHLVRLVDDLLDVSRITLGKLHLRRERLELRAAIDHTLDVCGSVVRDHGHELAVTLPDEPVYLDADRTRLSQAVCNLLTNAARYTPRGGRVTLAAAREGGEVVIRVADTGVGIPAHVLPRVFDLFVQADRSLEKSQGGLGVGLAIVKRLVEMHGGTVTARSDGPGQGSEFVIRLPVANEERGTMNDESRPGGAGASIHHSSFITHHSRRVLVVDDNADAADSLAAVLRLGGHEVRTAADGAAGVAAAEEFRPDVVFLDLGMPRLNGYDAARRIRGRPWGRDVLLIALTGWGHDEDRRRSQEAGFDRHLTKPVDPDTLDELLAKAPAAGG